MTHCRRAASALPVPGGGWRILPAGLLALLACTAASRAGASCAAPLPDAGLRPLDARLERDPSGTLAEARRRLAALPAPDPLAEAQLYALVADANSLLEDDAQVQVAAAEGRARLERLPEGEARRALRLRIELAAAESPRTSTEIISSIEFLRQLEATLPQQSLDRACLLTVRTALNARALRNEEATTDGLAAYRIATSLGARDAAADAAYHLAYAYTRAGLYEEAQTMAQIANEYYRATGQETRLADGLYQQASVLEKLREHERALALNAEVRAINARGGQSIAVAYDDLQKCGILISLARLESARQSCEAARPALAAAGRDELVAVADRNLARIDIARGRAAAAIGRLDGVLAAGADKVAPSDLPSIYQYRSEAHGQLGQHREALRDLQEAARLAAANDETSHSLAAVRLKERLTASELREEKLALESQVRLERERTANLARQSRLRLALAAALVALLLAAAYILWRRARHERALSTAASTLESQAHVISTVREGVLLVDRAGLVRYANPAAALLFGTTREALLGVAAARLGIRRELLPADDGSAPAGVAGGPHELQWQDAGGARRTLLLSCSPVALREDALIVCLLQEVTELRQLERRLFSSATDERERIGTEVQEGLLQELASVAQLLQGIEGRTGSDATKLEYLDTLVNELVENARAIVQGLTPVPLGSGSLPAALQRLAEEEGLEHGIRIACHCDLGELRIGPWQADHLFRIARECLALARAERDGGELALDLRVSGDALCLAVDTQRARVGSGDGAAWHAIAYLTHVIGGTARVEPTIACARRRTIHVPLAALVAGKPELPAERSGAA